MVKKEPDELKDISLAGIAEVGKYVVGSFIDSGSSGLVYNIKNNDILVLKVVRFKAKEEIANEVKMTKMLCKTLKHITYLEHSFNFDQSRFIFVLPKYETTLHNYFQKSKPLSIEVIKKFTGHLLKGLNYLFEKKIIHKDIKPDNIMLDKDENLYIVDFGKAKELGDKKDTDYGYPENGFGAPELLWPTNPLPPLTCGIDTWAAAIVLGFLKTGNIIFGKEYKGVMLYNMLNVHGVPDENIMRELVVETGKSVQGERKCGFYQVKNEWYFQYDDPNGSPPPINAKLLGKKVILQLSNDPLPIETNFADLLFQMT